MQSRFTTLEEFYAAVDALIGKLRSERCPDSANRLYTLLHKVAWTSSSELLGELMLVLIELRGHSPDNLRLDISECLEFTLNHRQLLNLQ